MVAAKIELGWENKIYECETPFDIIRKVEEYQDFGCLIRMGRREEKTKGQKELDRLEAFLEKYHEKELTLADIKDLNIHLSIGDIICHGIAEGEEEIARLKGL